MQIFRHNEPLPASVRGASVAVGNFDGVHRGHQAVIGEAGRIAKAQDAPWAVLSFEPHPRALFKPDEPPFRLTTPDAKARLIEGLGVDALIIVDFGAEFAATPPEAFVHDVLMERLGAHHVVAGYDFAFGKGRQGNCELLLRMGQDAGFGFTAVHPVRNHSGDIFSSSLARKALRAGDPDKAARVLGRSFEIEGVVEHGDQRGRTIGFPTANLNFDDVIRPKHGVYAVLAGIDEGEATVWRQGVANIGNRPTVDGKDVNLEVFLFQFDDNLYGRRLRVRLIDFIREEKKFDGLDALRAQIALDCDTAHRILAQV